MIKNRKGRARATARRIRDAMAVVFMAARRHDSKSLHRVSPRVHRLAASHRIGHRQDRRPRRERSQPGVRPAGLQGHRGGERARRNLGH